VLGLAPTAYSVNTVSLRQAITPDLLRGRVNASMRFVMWGTMPIGSLLGGGLLGTLWVVFSPAADAGNALALTAGRHYTRASVEQSD